jgi:glycosyltransferase involved in cell wall biosynthesis
MVQMPEPEPAPPEGRRFRVLVLAESAHPRAQSVSLVGWAHSRALAEVADVHLVTRLANRDAILAAGLLEGRDFTAVDTSGLERAVNGLAGFLRGDPNKGWTTLMALSLPAYWAFERAAWKQFRERIQGRAFDVVHRITPVSPSMPSLIAAHCARAGVPFVLGPLNGGLPWPPQFQAVRRAEGEWLSYVRGVYRLVPGYRASRRHAAAILAGSRSALGEIPGRWRHKTIFMPENGIDPGRFPAPPGRQRTMPLKALFIGRLVPGKGLDMAIASAAALIRRGSLELDVVGDGPERKRLTARIAEAGLEGRVRMHGTVPPDRVRQYLVPADLLLFPSIHDFGGGVVLEAMAMGVVPVVVDYGGPGDLVDAASGIAVPLADRDAIIAGLAAALERLARAPGELDRMGANARQRVETLFTWRRKAEQDLEVYAWALGRRAAAPCFPFLPAGAAQAGRPYASSSYP